LAARDARCNAYAAYVAARIEEDDDEPEPVYGWQQVDEDPLQALGRFVKVASKTLWKRVSNKDVAAAAAAAAAATASLPNQMGSPTSTSPTLRPILGSITSNLTSNVDDYHHHLAEEEEELEGMVWEEEIGDSFPRDISQTETIIEGRAVYYSLPTSKVEVVSRSPPPPPSVSNLKKKMLTKPPGTKKLLKVKQGS
jgi:hypothetical protein